MKVSGWSPAPVPLGLLPGAMLGTYIACGRDGAARTAGEATASAARMFWRNMSVSVLRIRLGWFTVSFLRSLLE